MPEKGGLRAEPFLDVRSDLRGPSADQLETGLVGFATAPDFADARPGDDAGYPQVTGPCWADGALAASCGPSAAPPVIPPVLEHPFSVGQILSGVAVVPPQVEGQLAGRALVADWAGTLLVAQPGPAPWAYTTTDLSDTVHGQYLWDLDATPDGRAFLLLAGRRMGQGEGAILLLTEG